MSDLNMYKERQQQSIHVEQQKEQLQNKRAITSPPGDDMGAPVLQKERDAIKLLEQEAVELTEENVGDVQFVAQQQSEVSKDPIVAKAESKNINMISSTGSQNLHRIQNGIEPKLNTKYVD